MARYISRHARYGHVATALAVAGALSCLGALTTGHGVTLLVVGMMSFSASMLVMSLRPPKEISRESVPQCARCPGGEQTVELRVCRIGVDGRRAGPPGPDGDGDAGTRDGPERWTPGDGAFPSDEELDRALELITEMGANRSRERKNRTWSI